MWLYKYLTLSYLVTQLIADPFAKRKWITITKKDSTKSYQSGTCVPGCLTCSAVNGCISCHPLLFLFLHREGMRQLGTCLHSCPSGYYGMRRRMYSKCVHCAVPNCESCLSRTHCTICTPPYLAYRGKCVSQCPASLYYAEYTKECKHRVDCGVGLWGGWSTCQRKGQICGYKYGSSDRSRDVLQPPSPNGRKCPPLTETRRCRLKYRTCADTLSNNSEPSRVLIPSQHQRRRGRQRGRSRSKSERGKKSKRRRLGRRWRTQVARWNQIDETTVSTHQMRKLQKSMDSKLALTTNQITALAVL